jgi:hypothetical protein
MKLRLSYLISTFALIALLGFHSTARADDLDLKTVFSINQPVVVPGHVVLPAGSYVIKRLNTIGPVVQILNESETKVFATLLPVQDAVSPSDKATLGLEESSEGLMALKTWYYPGRDTAYEFITRK